MHASAGAVRRPARDRETPGRRASSHPACALLGRPHPQDEVGPSRPRGRAEPAPRRQAAPRLLGQACRGPSLAAGRAPSRAVPTSTTLLKQRRQLLEGVRGPTHPSGGSSYCSRACHGPGPRIGCAGRGHIAFRCVPKSASSACPDSG